MTVVSNTRLREERGQVIVMAALLLPLFLLLTALVVDTGDWYTHKRSLQNRADAGALAAGVEYLAQLSNCLADPTPTGPAATAIAAKAKQYAGSTPGDFNETVNKQSQITVKVNALTPTSADNGDGGGPCDDHAVTSPADPISPAGGIWTDVKVRETDIGTLFASFGLNLSEIAAQARVEVKQLVGVRHGGLPFINEIGDYVPCAWAQFVRVRDGSTSGILQGISNPVLLTADPTTPRRWTASVPGIDITSSTDDIAVRYWMGSKTGNTCDFNTQQKGVLPAKSNGSGPFPIDWINVYEDDSPGANEAPMLHHFQLTPGTCGPDRVGFIYSTTPCNVNFSAEIDHGANPAPSKIIVESVGRNPPLQGVSANATGPGPYYSGQLTFDPNAVTGSTTLSQDYTQVADFQLRVRWEQTSGMVGAQNCTTGSPCTGTFLSELPNNVQQATYVADPLNSNPLFSAELMNGASPLQNSWAAGGPDTPPFTIVLTNVGVDLKHIVLVRESVQATGNRTFTVQCWPTGGGTPFLGTAIDQGCPVPVTVNQRNGSCTPAPPLANGSWDCVETLPGNHNGIRQYFPDRWDCSMANHWDGTSPDNLSDDDPRYAYIFLTDFGRIANVNPNVWLPIRAFLRIYVTGWDSERQQDGPELCGGANDPPPRGYDGNGSQIWGHFVDVITLNDDVIPGDDECKLDQSVVTCKPVLVR